MRPVVKRAPGMSKYERLPEACTYTPDDSGASLEWRYEFTQEEEVAFFAFTYPYTYTECEAKIKELAEKAQGMDDVYFHNNKLLPSPQGRNVHLLTISSLQGQMSHVLLAAHR